MNEFYVTDGVTDSVTVNFAVTLSVTQNTLRASEYDAYITEK